MTFTMDENKAKQICSLSVLNGIKELEKFNPIIEIEDETIIYNIGDYAFFKAYSDSKTLYYEC